MSTERELAEKFKEAIETKNIDIIYPHLVDGMTYEILPSTLVVVVIGELSDFWMLWIQGRKKTRQRWMERPDDRYVRGCPVCQG